MGRGRIALVAAGTGGHILPGIRIGRALEERGWEISYISGGRAIEERIYGSEGVGPWRLPVDAGTDVGAAGRWAGLARATAAVMARFAARRPGAVLAMGGAAAVPVLAVARALAIPYFLHESNRIPGRATRLFRRGARRVYTGLGGVEGDNVVRTGTPTAAAPVPDAPRDVVLCVGGSQGAARLNGIFVRAANEAPAGTEGLRFVLVAGPGKTVLEAGRVEVLEYAEDLPALLARTRVVVSRAGAGALADIANHRLPAILVPYPHAKDDHQWANARVYTECGAATAFSEGDLTADRLGAAISRLVASEEECEGFREALARFDSQHAARNIAEDIGRSLRQTAHQAAVASGKAGPA